MGGTAGLSHAGPLSPRRHRTGLRLLSCRRRGASRAEPPLLTAMPLTTFALLVVPGPGVVRKKARGIGNSSLL